MVDAAAVCACRYGAGDGLFIDTAKVRHSETMAIELVAKGIESNTSLHRYQTTLSIDGEDLVELVEVDEPTGCAGDVGRRMTATSCDEAAAAATSKAHHLLDLCDGLGLDVELGEGRKGMCPGSVDMAPGRTEGNAIVGSCALELGGCEGMHGRGVERGGGEDKRRKREERRGEERRGDRRRRRHK